MDRNRTEIISESPGQWLALIAVESLLRVSLTVAQFPGFNGKWKNIFLGRQRARRVRRKNAGRVVGLVEIEVHLSVHRHRRVHEAAWLVG